jgi:type III pantothenate kinase
MILLIDAGNSRIKSAIRRDDNTFVELEAVPTASMVRPKAWNGIDAPGRVLVSSVAGAEVNGKLNEWSDELWSLQPVFARVRAEAAGMTTDYENPAQLGVDRWLAALAGYHLARGAACVVDAGTALTVDIVDDDGVHRGGSISPGLALMVESLTRNTAQLRLDSLTPTDSVATNTAAAISAGCIDAFAGGLERTHASVVCEFGDEAPWFVTGGEAQTIIELCRIEFRPVPDLVLRGLALAEGNV